MKLADLMHRLAELGADHTPCPVLSRSDANAVEQKLGFRLPTEYVELLRHVGSFWLDSPLPRNLFVWNLQESLGHMRLPGLSLGVSHGPEYVCDLFIKVGAVIVGTDDNGTYFFIRKAHSNTSGAGPCRVHAFEMDTIDEYEMDIKNAAQIVKQSVSIADSLAEFIEQRLAPTIEYAPGIQLIVRSNTTGGAWRWLTALSSRKRVFQVVGRRGKAYLEVKFKDRSVDVFDDRMSLRLEPHGSVEVSVKTADLTIAEVLGVATTSPLVP